MFTTLSKALPWDKVEKAILKEQAIGISLHDSYFKIYYSKNKVLKKQAVKSPWS